MLLDVEVFLLLVGTGSDFLDAGVGDDASLEEDLDDFEAEVVLVVFDVAGALSQGGNLV